jgi:hypothetical protein
MPVQQNILALLLVVPASLLLTGQADSATLTVSKDRKAVGAAFYRTIQSAVDKAKPGDTVLVSAGSYKEEVTLRASGSRAQAIKLSGVGRVVIDRRGAGGKGIVGRGVGFWVIDGFEIVGAVQGIKFVDAHDIAVVDCHMQGGVTGFALEGASAQNLRVERCVAKNNRAGGFEIAGRVAAEKILFLKCAAVSNDCKGGADGFGISHGCTTRDVRFESCTAAHNGSDGFDLSGKKGFGVTVVGCAAHHNGTKMWGCNFKCWNPGSIFINCVAWKTGKTADANFAAYADKVRFLHCTSGENADAGFMIGGRNCELTNCISAYARKSAVAYRGSERTALISNMLLFSCGSVSSVPLGRSGNRKGDPRFIDWKKGDYRIGTGSAAAGRAHHLKEVPIDQAGIRRPKESPAIGAFEPKEI